MSAQNENAQIQELESKIQKLEQEKQTLIGICCGNTDLAEDFRAIMRAALNPAYLRTLARDGGEGVVSEYFAAELEADRNAEDE